MYYDLQQVLYNNSATFTHSHYVHIGMFYPFLSPYYAQEGESTGNLW